MAPGDAQTNVVVLGSTGSVGRSTLSVVAHDSGRRLKVRGLGAHRPGNRWSSRRGRSVLVTSPWPIPKRRPASTVSFADWASRFSRARRSDPMVQDPETDRVLERDRRRGGTSRDVGRARGGQGRCPGQQGDAGGRRPARHGPGTPRGGLVLPVDSEHSAIFQALRSGEPKEVRRVILTSSGGPVPGIDRRDLADVTPDAALRHPTWRMGPKSRSIRRR